MSGHDLYSPSRLAQLENCLDWESAGDGEAATYGTHIHSLIEHIATDKAIEANVDDIAIADRALRWLASLGDLRWEHETFIKGFLPDTGGTIDAWARDKANRRLIIVDWKGSLPAADSMQGKAYALNLFMALPEHERQMYDCISVYFHNYMNGECCHASYTSEKTLAADIGALIRRHSGQMGQRRSACSGCAYCKHNANCQEAMVTTTTQLSAPCDMEVMPINDLLAFYDRLKAVMKRAEALESSAKARLMEAAKAGELPGYCVKSKRGNKLEWADEASARTTVQAILANAFADAKVDGLLPPSTVKAALKAALGASYTSEVEAQLAPYISQNSYEYLAKDNA